LAEFAELVSKLPLYQELDRTVGRDSIAATDVARLKGLVNAVADSAGTRHGPDTGNLPAIHRA
jgi:hypothetical protein